MLILLAIETPLNLMDTTELESVTSSMSTKRSNQLSYASENTHCTLRVDRL
jgi:hypothetical protein